VEGRRGEWHNNGTPNAIRSVVTSIALSSTFQPSTLFILHPFHPSILQPARRPHPSTLRPLLSARFQPHHVALFLAKYAWLTMRRRPILVHFEVTLRCNAHCSFCDYWKTDASARATELKHYG